LSYCSSSSRYEHAERKVWGGFLAVITGTGWRKLGAESTKHVEDLGSFTDRLADSMQCISDLLEAASIRRNVQITLDQTPELRL
jgi:hypothetical protein